MYFPFGILQQQTAGLPTSGLLMQLDGAVPESFWSDDGKTINSSEGGVVAVWEDQSGNGNDWVQTNNSYRPLAHLSANRLYNNGGGTGVIDKHLTGPNISAWTGGSFFARVQNIGGPQGSMWGTTSWNNSSSVGHWSYTGDNGSHYVCFGATARPNAFAWSGQAESSLDLMNYEENIDTDGTMQVYINGTQRYSAYASTPAFRTVPYLGCGVRSNAQQFSTGSYFYKVCAYDRVVTAEERTQILAWLNA